jgi:hypothetical protein
VVELVEERGIPVVTMSRKRFNPDLVTRLAVMEVDSLVHTVNRPDQMTSYVDQGLRGIYSDRFVVWDEVLSAISKINPSEKAPPRDVPADPPRE